MKNFKLINTVSGWVTFAIAFVVYSLTVEPSVSLWDCGEFISASYKLQVVHPPGAPLFLMLGRVFSLFASSPEGVALAVNMLSVLSSALTVLFTFWITTHFAKKISGLSVNAVEVSMAKGIGILGAGLVAGLALTFSDSFWFSAVEAEVYAISSCFTALTFWCILKWEQIKDQPTSERWLILIFYLVGLAVGLHLLNLLVIPAVIYYYFFNRYAMNRANIIKSSAIGFGILALLQWGLIPGIPTITAYLDLLFVNSFGLPFNSGSVFGMLVLFALAAYGVYYTHQKGKAVMNLVFLSVTFFLIGYSSYTMVVIRSIADPAIDMNNPEDSYSLLSYIKREQYGDRPLVKGPYYTAKLVDVEDGKMQYRKGEEGYEEIGPKVIPIYDPKHSTVFPRMGDQTEKSRGYPLWCDYKGDGSRPPEMKHNLQFLWRYQLGWVYKRYFMWNFVGRQSDIQNIDGNIFDGNWLSGVNFLDAMRLGPQDNIPDSLTQNKGRNKYYYIPFILGILGMIIQFRKSKLDGVTVLTLFLFTGVMIILFLNQPPLEPRERDYSHAGSFQTFCIWVGLGVLFLADFLTRFVNKTAAGGLAVLLALTGPVLMGSQNWDDHDRSNRYLGISFAKNYLNSCGENGILFTNGDNDTYPLWYAQNVEGIRTDVRIINLSLLSTDWYSNALRDSVYKSAPLPMTIPANKLKAGEREYLRFADNPNLNIDKDQFYPLDKVIEFMTSDEQSKMVRQYDGEYANYMPVKQFVIPIDKNRMLANGVISPKDSSLMVDAITFKVNQNGLSKGSLVVLDILSTNAKNGWKRPIHFTTMTSNSVYLGMDDYLRLEGLTYRLLPMKGNPRIKGMTDPDLVYDLLMDDYVWGNMENGDIYVDDKATLVPLNLRRRFLQLSDLYIEKGNKEKAKALLDKCLKSMPESVLPMDNRLKVFLIRDYFRVGDTETGTTLLMELSEDLEEQVRYYGRFKGSQKRLVSDRKTESTQILGECLRIAKQYISDSPEVEEIQAMLEGLQ